MPLFGFLRTLKYCCTFLEFLGDGKLQKGAFSGARKSQKGFPKTPKRYIIRGQKMPKCVTLRPLLTPKRPPKYQVPNNSKKVQFQAPEKAKIWTFKATLNSKKALCASKLQNGAISGTRKKLKYGHLRPLLTPKKA